MVTIREITREAINLNHKSFRSVPGAFVIPITCLLTSFVFVSLMVFCFYNRQINPLIFCECALFVVGGIIGFIFSSQQSMCSVVLYDDRVLCKIPFSKNVELVYDKCYIGVDYHVQNGGKIWWIYFSYGKMPPYKNSHLGNRINSIKCQPGFVRIMYRDEIYEALLEVLPEKQKTALVSVMRCSGFEKKGRII